LKAAVTAKRERRARAVDGKSDRVNHIAFSLSNAIEISSQPRRPLYDRRVIPTPTTYDYAAEYPLSPTVNSPTTSNNGVTSPSIATNNITFPPPPNTNVPPYPLLPPAWPRVLPLMHSKFAHSPGFYLTFWQLSTY
jgi:hypothetical protein